MIDLLYRLTEHRARWWIVTTVTGMVALILLWPAVDDYFAAEDHRRELHDSLAEIESTVSNLDQFASLVSEKQTALTELEQKTLSADSVAQFRNRLVQMVRQTGCQMRRVRLGEPSQRTWKKDDDPLSLRSTLDKGDETPFELRTQLLSISLTGSVKNINLFLTELRKLDSFVHTMNLSLRRSQEGDQAAILELDLLLLDLDRPDKISA